MARVVKEKEYAVRRNEILDATQQLVYTKGYEQMAIRDIVDELHISKGALYHYFDSKQALLEALLERMMDQIEEIIVPIVKDPDLPALEKLERYFGTIARWKTARKEYLLRFVTIWYADDNAIVRQKTFGMMIERVAPMINDIIRQGIQEGVMSMPYPDQAGQVVVSLLQSLGDYMANMLLSFDPQCDGPEVIKRSAAMYRYSLERVLGAPPGSLHLFDDEWLEEWFPQFQAAVQPSNGA